MRTMSYREFLATPEDYRSVTQSPRRCAVLTLDAERGTILESVRITDDYSATIGRTTTDRYGDRGYLAVTVRTQALGEQAPYFSVTGELWDSEGWYRRGGPDGRMRMCGCLHDETLAAFPNLAPLVALHLADATTGEPMYAIENGWYHYRQDDTAAVARLWRMPEDEIPADMDEDGVRAFVEAQRARWQDEATAGRALILALGGVS